MKVEIEVSEVDMRGIRIFADMYAHLSEEDSGVPLRFARLVIKAVDKKKGER